MKNNKMIYLVVVMLVFVTISPSSFADCSKYKKSCMGSGCKDSIADYKQCVSDENKKARDARDILAKANAVKLKERSKKVSENSSPLKLSVLNKKPGFEYVTIFQGAALEHKYTFKAFETAASWLKDAVYRSLQDECWDTHKGYIEKTTISYTTFEQGHVQDVSADYKLSAKSKNAICRYRKKEEKKQEKKEEEQQEEKSKEDDFWQGDTDEPTTKIAETTAEDDDFWNGGNKQSEKVTKNTNQTQSDSLWDGGDDVVSNTKTNDSDFWNGNTNDSGNSDDIWIGAGAGSDAKDYEIKNKDGKQGVISKSGKILIPFRGWEILSFRSGLASVKTQGRQVERKECSYKSGSFWYAYVDLYNKGIVDKSGQWLTPPKEYARIDFWYTSSSSFFLTYKKDSEYWEKVKREENKKYWACKEKVKNHKSEYINRYRAKGYIVE